MTFDLTPFLDNEKQPFGFQRRVLDETWSKPYWAWFLEQGLGKSLITIFNAVGLYGRGEIDTLVVMGKKGEIGNWIYDQLPTHLPKWLDVEMLLYRSAAGAKQDYRDRLKSLLKPDKRRLRVLAINVEALITDSAKAVLAALFKSSAGVLLALDESTCAKHTDSKRSREIYLWAAKAKYKRIMTGTPMTERPMDLWGQSLVLGKGILGHNSFYSFRGEYANLETLHLGTRTVQTIKSYKNLDKLGRVMQRFSTTLSKADCLDLPEKLYSKLVVELTTEQQKLYDKMHDEALLELEGGGEVEVTSVLAQMTKLHQIACGQLKTGPDEYISIPNNRMPALMDKLEDYPGKVIIWATYRQTIKDVIAELQRVYGEEAVAGYFGGVKEDDRRDAVKNFQDPKHPLRFFVANPQSAGYGLTLTQANLSIYYSQGYSLEHRLQSEDRNHRIGQNDKVTYIDLVARGTIDEKIIDMLQKKQNISTQIMQGAKWRDLFA